MFLLCQSLVATRTNRFCCGKKETGQGGGWHDRSGQDPGGHAEMAYGTAARHSRWRLAVRHGKERRREGVTNEATGISINGSSSSGRRRRRRRRRRSSSSSGGGRRRRRKSSRGKSSRRSGKRRKSSSSGSRRRRSGCDGPQQQQGPCSPLMPGSPEVSRSPRWSASALGAGKTRAACLQQQQGGTTRGQYQDDLQSCSKRSCPQLLSSSIVGKEE